MDYKKKSLNKLNHKESYEEIDTRLASGWYVDAVDNKKKKKYKTEKVSFKISKKMWMSQLIIYLKTQNKYRIYKKNWLYNFRKWHKLFKNVFVDTWFCMPKYTILRCTLNFVWGNLWSFSKAYS